MTATNGPAPAADRDYDLVLLGATGFTGQLTAAYLANHLGDGPTRWALAGRDRERLAALAARLPNLPAIEVVDTGDLVGLLELAARTRVIATTVGPYLRHGELVVQACVRAGTHYLDVTGEPAFVDLLLSRYDADARRGGVKLVNCCGFESVPPDLGASFTVGQLPDDAPLTVRGYLHVRMRPSGGTIATVLDGSAHRRRASSVPAPLPGGRPIARLATGIHRVAELDAWAVPLPTIDTDVVLRSAQVLEGYGSRVRYGHHLLMRHLPAAVAGLAGAGIAGAATRFPPTRSLLARALPSPGEGPDEASRARSWFQLTFLGEGGGQRVVTRVSGGEPGYETTAVTLGEAARLLVDGAGPDVAGVLTPAVALGTAYRDRLAAAGLTFEVLAGPDAPGHPA